MTSGPIRVLVVDDQALVRSGFTMILDAQPDISVVGEAADGAEAIQAATQLRPDVILMDVRMPKYGRHPGHGRDLCPDVLAGAGADHLRPR